ncbi:MAG TPA: hypothetical protein VFF68_07755 [Anaerolineaceae bacterium]|nr:hypothetical protein [Anaerolineaceae bacterium]
MTADSKKFDDDDGRVICNMDVEGMRWHDQRVRRENRAARLVPQGEQLTESESRRFTWHAVLAGMVIVGVFSATWVLFILFCTQVWFR